MKDKKLMAVILAFCLMLTALIPAFASSLDVAWTTNSGNYSAKSDNNVVDLVKNIADMPTNSVATLSNSAWVSLFDKGRPATIALENETCDFSFDMYGDEHINYYQIIPTTMDVVSCGHNLKINEKLNLKQKYSFHILMTIDEEYELYASAWKVGGNGNFNYPIFTTKTNDDIFDESYGYIPVSNEQIAEAGLDVVFEGKTIYYLSIQVYSSTGDVENGIVILPTDHRTKIKTQDSAFYMQVRRNVDGQNLGHYSLIEMQYDKPYTLWKGDIYEGDVIPNEDTTPLLSLETTDEQGVNLRCLAWRCTVDPLSQFEDSDYFSPNIPQKFIISSDGVFSADRPFNYMESPSIEVVSLGTNALYLMIDYTIDNLTSIFVHYRDDKDSPIYYAYKDYDNDPYMYYYINQFLMEIVDFTDIPQDVEIDMDLIVQTFFKYEGSADEFFDDFGCPEGYSFKDIQYDLENIRNKEVLDIYILFDRNSYNFNVFCVDGDTNKEIQKKNSFQKKYSEFYKIDPPAVYGYDFVKAESEDELSGQLLNPSHGDYEFTFKYTLKNSSVTTHWIDTEGNNLASPKTTEYKVFDEYDTEQKSFTGYSLKEIKGQKSGTVSEEPVDVTFVYEKTKYNYSVMASIDKGGSVGVEPMIFVGKTASVTDSVTQGESKHTVVYFGIFDTYYIDTVTIDGTVFEQTVLFKGADDYSYAFDDINITDKIEHSINVTTLPKDATIIIHYIDENGKTIAPDDIQTTKCHYKYNTAPKEIEGFVLKEMPTNANGVAETLEIEISYVYVAKTSKVFVKYIDEISGYELDSFVLEGKFGESYSTEAKGFDGYALSQTPTNANGFFSENDIEVVYFYNSGLIEEDGSFTEEGTDENFEAEPFEETEIHESEFEDEMNTAEIDNIIQPTTGSSLSPFVFGGILLMVTFLLLVGNYYIRRKGGNYK